MSDGLATILVVDDEPGILGLVSMQLQRKGYTVLAVDSGLEALSVLASRADVTLVLSDCDMPNMSGPDLDKVILARWPHIAVVAMSGKPRPEDLPGEVVFIQKPFRGADLAAVIESALNREPAKPRQPAAPMDPARVEQSAAPAFRPHVSGSELWSSQATHVSDHIGTQYHITLSNPKYHYVYRS